MICGRSQLAEADDDLLVDRLAKQVLSTSIKAMGVAARRTGCVTSMALSLAEFDLKAQTPCAEVWSAYSDAVRNHPWH